MRIRVVCKPKDRRFPLAYRMMISSLIKKSIETVDESYFREMYYYGEKKNKKIKPFTFSVFFNDYKIEKEEVMINGQVSIILSTSDYNFGIILYNGLLKLKSYFYKNNETDSYEIDIQRVILEKEKLINDERILCKTLSPIHIKDKTNKPVSIESNEFVDGLNYISNIALETIRGEGLREELKFTPIKNIKKVVAKEEITDFKQITKKRYIYIEGYSGSFYLEGNIEDLRMLMQIGLGFRRSEGFGLIDLV
ncbi:CRISPR-associated endoribonuclease Cas6 [Clostridium cibarium]|uniref:CRISPR-associated endoribonuclease Cas6 n=1 Tax=Clostridium cibarium TaxID=2762247 RepID=A0ABR8PV70_9CLOT|nr:CRISPR-associated endoribonuclease Cas6 [Clostridium cibarium]MBD7912071.1 CRISPR-associated endoribonuclease Cas6 [Clostridium cibarium]